MSRDPQNRWRLLARLLKVIGATGYVLSFTYSLILTSYYSAKRPHVPQPERDWTISVEWTHPPSYGTAKEANRFKLLFQLCLPFFGLIALGEAIKVYKLDDYSGIPGLKEPQQQLRNRAKS